MLIRPPNPIYKPAYPTHPLAGRVDESRSYMVKGFTIGVVATVVSLSGMAGIPPAFAQEPDLVHAFDRCKIITDDKVRLRCLQDIVSQDGKKAAPPTSQSPWRLVRTPDPRGGRQAVSIMRTADTLRSDLDLAGLMIRCGEATDVEVLVALVNPLSLRAHPNVAITAEGSQTKLAASIAPPGPLILLPNEAAALADGPWRDLKELEITVEDPETTVHGVIALDGLGPALANLRANCPRNDPKPPG